jgi:hypothetical protein
MRSARLSNADLRPFANPISVADDAFRWMERPCGRLVCRDLEFSVELAIRNDSPIKRVGIIWSSDSWRTHQVANASYAGLRGDGLERWLVSVNSGPYEGQLEYAAFVEMNGATLWDPFNNHDPLVGATPERPVSVGAVEWRREDGSAAVTLEVEVESFPWSTDAQVTLWSRWQEEGEFAPVACRKEDATSWHCERPVSPRSGLGAHHMEFFVEATMDGRTVRDDNNGSYFRASPYPQPQVEILESKVARWAGERDLSGVIGFHCSVAEDARLVTIEMRLDGEVDWRHGATLFLSTATLSSGKHTVECRAHSRGADFVSRVQFEFNVANLLEPRGSVALPWQGMFALSGGERFERALGFDKFGLLYVQVQSGGAMRVAKVGIEGAVTGAVEYLDAHGGGSLGALAVSDRGDAWGWLSDSDRIVAWHSDGKRRTDWGSGGAVDLGLGNGAGRRSMVAVGDRLLVTSPWRREVLLLSASGDVLSRVVLSDALFDSSNEGRSPVLGWDGVSLWWFDSLNLVRFSIRENILSVQEVTKTARPFPLTPVAMLPIADGTFIVAAMEPAALYTISARGEWRGVWFGTNRGSGVAGDISAPSALGFGADRSLLVGMDGSAQLSRFHLP